MDSFNGIIEFVAVAETGGFSAAAKKLNCSTSHISRQVSRLEDRLSCILLARSTRLVTLTESGTVYYQQAKDLVTGLQQANEQVNLQQVNLNGTLRVSSAGGFAEKFLAPALMEFSTHHPDLTVDLQLDSKFVNFAEDGIDFAVRYGELNDSNLIARKLVSRPMMAVASNIYLEKQGLPKKPSDLKVHNCIVANNNAWTFVVNGQNEVVKVKGKWRSNNVNVTLDACKNGLGIAYLPKSTFSEALALNQVTPILEPYWGKGSSSWIVYQNKQYMPMRVRLAIDFLTQYFSKWDTSQ